jgi:glutamyl/glutaminyl-tRNA synthetase
LSHLLKAPLIFRFEDIDGPRVVPNAQVDQLSDMKSLGIQPDKVIVQSTNLDRHFELFQFAKDNNKIYACDCSRSEVRESLNRIASAPHQKELEYSGRCRDLARKSSDLSAFKATDSIAWRWRHENPSGQDDCIVARTDLKSGAFQPGYHWACAIDDADGEYNWLVRAWDLASAERTQSQIRHWVKGLAGGQDQARVYHTTLVTRDNGQRIEKRTKGVTLLELSTLGYQPPQIVELFAKSFSIQQEKQIQSFAVSAKGVSILENGLVGEAACTMTLSKLGLVLS